MSFWKTYFICWMLLLSLLALTVFFMPYKEYPLFGVIGYSILVLLLLYCFYEAHQQEHYIVISITLILLGAGASFDMILSADKIYSYWKASGLPDFTEEQFRSFKHALIILLNIFTGSLAANGLFYGLNRRNFNHSA